jgi:hypothetical protein
VDSFANSTRTGQQRHRTRQVKAAADGGLDLRSYRAWTRRKQWGKEPEYGAQPFWPWAICRRSAPRAPAARTRRQDARSRLRRSRTFTIRTRNAGTEIPERVRCRGRFVLHSAARRRIAAFMRTGAPARRAQRARLQRCSVIPCCSRGRLVAAKRSAKPDGPGQLARRNACRPGSSGFAEFSRVSVSD